MFVLIKVDTEEVRAEAQVFNTYDEAYNHMVKVMNSYSEEATALALEGETEGMYYFDEWAEFYIEEDPTINTF